MPLAAPGIVAGVMITLIPALGAYLTPDLMGGTDSQMIANVIERQFKKANDWPFGAALSFLLIYAMFVIDRAAGIAPRKAQGGNTDGPVCQHGARVAPLDYRRNLWMRAWVGR